VLVVVVAAVVVIPQQDWCLSLKTVAVVGGHGEGRSKRWPEIPPTETGAVKSNLS